MSTAVNPGNLRSDLQRYLPKIMRTLSVGNPLFLYLILLIPLSQHLATYPTAYGALTQLWAGTSIDGAKFGGKVRITDPF